MAAMSVISVYYQCGQFVVFRWHSHWNKFILL